jgi:hypothetical protein
VASVLIELERRRDHRRDAAQFGFAPEALLRPGILVAVVELSAGGALVEGAAAVRPGGRTELGLDRFDGERRAMPARVVRCWVSALVPLRYRCAVCFDDPLAVG